MKYSNTTRATTLLVIILFLLATFGVVVMYLADPHAAQQEVTIQPQDIEITQPEIVEPEINDSLIDIDLIPTTTDPIESGL